MFSKLKECPSCKRKVEKSQLLSIETTVGTVVKCCENCVSYFKVRRVLK